MTRSHSSLYASLLTAACLSVAVPCWAMTKTSVHTGSINATGHITATIAEAIAVVAQTPLIFGYIEPGSTAGTVTVTTSDRRTSSGNVKLLDGVFERAMFMVRGSPNRSYTMQVPKTLTFKAQDTLLLSFSSIICELEKKSCPTPVSSLTAENFVTYSTNDNKETTSAQLNGAGLDTVYLGGTLVVPDNVAPGLYSAIVPLTVAY